METITLYRYIRSDGGVSISPVMPDGECTELFRLVADEGMVLTDGEKFTSCTDTKHPERWTEVADTENPGYANEEDYQNALREMGVKV